MSLLLELFNHLLIAWSLRILVNTLAFQDNVLRLLVNTVVKQKLFWYNTKSIHLILPSLVIASASVTNIQTSLLYYYACRTLPSPINSLLGTCFEIIDECQYGEALVLLVHQEVNSPPLPFSGGCICLFTQYPEKLNTLLCSQGSSITNYWLVRILF